MKNFICLAMTAIVLSFVSCEKSTEESRVDNQLSPTLVNNLQVKARDFSLKHDQLVYDMLSLDHALKLQRSPSDGLLSQRERLDHVLTVIHRVTGVKPVIADQSLSRVSAACAGDDPDYYWVNLDVEQIVLAPYASSDIGLQYLGTADDILQNPDTGLDEKMMLLNELIGEVGENVTLSESEMERILTSLEVLKGSLSLWNDYLSGESVPLAVPGMSKVNIRDWSFGKKLAFVAAADAVGGVLGFFLGGYITVGGVPIYMPAGPTGLVLSAAALSYIAASMVGW